MHLRLEQAIRKLSDNPSLQSIAEQVFLSPRHLEFLFKTQAEMTFVAFCRELRMRYARQLLTETSVSIKEIAYVLGYKAVEVFCRDFKRMNGCTANAFRSRHGKSLSNLGIRQSNNIDK